MRRSAARCWRIPTKGRTLNGELTQGPRHERRVFGALCVCSCLGNIYVSDSGVNRVLKLAAGASSPSVLPFTDLNKPSAVAVDTAGDVYVLDDRNFRVLKLPAQ
ncbi:MAG: hypothetical protein QOJ20_259 [Mycobacterium sp.]|nr:hypothetical protein [Mycobacterium sp.]